MHDCINLTSSLAEIHNQHKFFAINGHPATREALITSLQSIQAIQQLSVGFLL